ncbi:hypothetical protein SASPL_138154 [Salvia splendens]|uniref:HIT domain-containing protein n=1 Tax=Salvia splendens TaxID=180675 RepID=A0A8X8WUU2_SALSN|nr:hypothetical protein SASPL_138154 [Salvia splendens]
MEARARRRLALLSSHVNPLIETSGTASFSSLIASACNGGNEMKKGEDDCVFCRIVHGEAPALKSARVVMYKVLAMDILLDDANIITNRSFSWQDFRVHSRMDNAELEMPIGLCFEVMRSACMMYVEVEVVLYEDDECVCILDTYPLCHGCAIIGAMCSKVPLISNAVMKVTGCAQKNFNHTDSFNLLVNNGAAAGQVIYHTHIHIIPRKANDCLWTSESIRRCPMDQEVSQLADRIRESLMFVSRYEDSKGQGSSLVVN